MYFSEGIIYHRLKKNKKHSTKQIAIYFIGERLAHTRERRFFFLLLRNIEYIYYWQKTPA